MKPSTSLLLTFLFIFLIAGDSTATRAEEILEPSTVETQADNPENQQEMEHPEIRPTQILPSKIKPVQDQTAHGEGLSKAAPDFQTAHTVESIESLEHLTIPPLDKEFQPDESWNDLSRKELIEQFTKLKASDTPLENRAKSLDTIRTVNYFSGSPPEEAPTAKEPDIYSLRLEKLLEFGDFEGVNALYSQNDNQPPTSLAAKAGILSLFWNKSFALGCLEYKAMLPQYSEESKTDQFWTKTGIFCDALLSPASGDASTNTDEDDHLFINTSRIYLTAQNIKRPESIEDLDKLGKIDVLALGGAGQLSQMLSDKANGSTEDQESLSKLTPSTLALCSKFGTSDTFVQQKLEQLVKTKPSPEFQETPETQDVNFSENLNENDSEEASLYPDESRTTDLQEKSEN
ncbi:MAG TPA: hypothetical protein PLK94_02310 [Alphaproteobacteria bacterium]|nr:hypothetical protein [Alphaproteobacteria bacterium]HOO50100.1 hypothetical protein [Alphaproteobacteria bacterium]